MGWIKRNLFFVVGGILALGFLGGAGFFIYQGWSSNADASAKLTEVYNKLQEIQSSPLKPGKAGDPKTDNMQLAKEQEKRIHDWISESSGFFHPIQPIPLGNVTSKTYATALGQTINLLTQEAKTNTVSLPPQCCFSFQVQNSKLNISSGLGPLAEQLGEVKSIVEILFAARVNNFENIQRVRVSDDDSAGSPADYLEDRPVTNGLAIITPYVVTFRSFSPELAKVLAGFATSTNFFIVKYVTVQNMGQQTVAAPDATAGPQNGYGPDGRQLNRNRGAELAGTKGGLPTVLKQQLLRVSMGIEIVKLLPKS